MDSGKTEKKPNNQRKRIIALFSLLFTYDVLKSC